jgi:tetratricopeptide (TPR) repeat protein
MILYGSLAAARRGIDLGRRPQDIDIVGTPEELADFRRANARHFTAEEKVQDHEAFHFHLRPELGFQKVEFHVAETASDRLLLGLTTGKQAPVLDSIAELPSLNALYLTKRAHLNYPLNWNKHFFDALRLLPRVTAFTEGELRYYRERKAETRRRFKATGARFTLKVSNEEFFRVSDHIRTYVHDDLHKAIAFNPGRPMYERSKTDQSSAILKRDMFEAQPFEDRCKLAQEEFFVIGIERFYIHDRSLSQPHVYAQGLMKTVRDLSSGWFQDFCLDNLRALAPPPSHDFIARFERAEKNGELRLVEGAANTKTIAAMLADAGRYREKGLFGEAEQLCQEVLSTEPENPAALLEMGMIGLHTKQPALAEPYIRRALRAEARNWSAWFALGMAMLQQSMWPEAIAAFRATIERKPDFAPAHLNLAVALEKEGLLEEAIALYRKARQLAPKQLEIGARLERALAARRNSAAASLSH